MNTCNNPYFNLALEEYVFTSLDPEEEWFILWQNRPAIIVGRNQNTIEEINQQLVEGKNIKVVRRITGGGAVYHDLGNLNFTFVVRDHLGSGFDFAHFTQPVVAALEKIGVQAENNGRNDITIQGKKFSGNSQYRGRGQLLHHGTLLFSSNLEEMTRVLQVDQEKISSKGVKSVRSRVTNISEHLDRPITIDDFKTILVQTIQEDTGHQPVYNLTEKDRQAIKNLVEKKYGLWEWNYGVSPPFNLQKHARFDWGRIDLRLDVKKGIINNLHIFGDFFANRDVDELKLIITGVPYNRRGLEKRLECVKVSEYLPGFSNREFIELLLG
ncbi:lipoate--protein ligase [Syntrophomonas erecta]